MKRRHEADYYDEEVEERGPRISVRFPDQSVASREISNFFTITIHLSAARLGGEGVVTTLFSKAGEPDVFGPLKPEPLEKKQEPEPLQKKSGAGAQKYAAPILMAVGFFFFF